MGKKQIGGSRMKPFAMKQLCSIICIKMTFRVSSTIENDVPTDDNHLYQWQRNISVGKRALPH